MWFDDIIINKHTRNLEHLWIDVHLGNHVYTEWSIQLCSDCCGQSRSTSYVMTTAVIVIGKCYLFTGHIRWFPENDKSFFFLIIIYDRHVTRYTRVFTHRGRRTRLHTCTYTYSIHIVDTERRRTIKTIKIFFFLS